jgi:hypothetical protein
MVLLRPVASRPRSPSFHARGPGRLGVMVLRLTLSGAAHAAVGLIVWCRGIAATKSSPIAPDSPNNMAPIPPLSNGASALSVPSVRAARSTWR